MNRRNIYLDNYDLEEAISIYLEEMSDIKLRTKYVDVLESVGYITAESVYPKCSSPNYNASAMDGISTRYEYLEEANENNPIILSKDMFSIVNTGDVISDEHNCVVMIEDVNFINESASLIKCPAYFENIRPIGEDISGIEMVLNKNHLIRAIDINSLINSFNKKVLVYDKLNCLIISTGKEIVSVHKEKLELGEIIDSNSTMVKYLCQELYFNVSIAPVFKGNIDEFKTLLNEEANNYDVIFINAGSSAGTEDFSAQAIRECGAVFVHGIAIKPGKPAILGRITNTFVIGLPGYPVSSYMVFTNVVRKVFNTLLNQRELYNVIEAKLSTSINSSLKYLEFVRVRVAYINDEYIAIPLNRGAGMSTSIQECDGIIEICKNSEGLEKGTIVNVKLIKHLSEIQSNTIITGSHDIVVDIISNISSLNISSTNVGSYNGIVALKNNNAHIAPVHILEDGQYNCNLQQHFEEEIVLIKGVRRTQGLIVKKGNPLCINSIKDIVNKRYVNRQKGSGTAMLLDYLLDTNNISSDSFIGYNFIAPNHLNVASLVASGTADVGLGIYSVAKEFNLDFIEVKDEEYDFLTYKKNLENSEIKQFISVLKSKEFARELGTLGGYNTCDSGEVVYFERST